MIILNYSWTIEALCHGSRHQVCILILFCCRRLLRCISIIQDNIECHINLLPFRLGKHVFICSWDQALYSPALQTFVLSLAHVTDKDWLGAFPAASGVLTLSAPVASPLCLCSELLWGSSSVYQGAGTGLPGQPSAFEEFTGRRLD